MKNLIALFVLMFAIPAFAQNPPAKTESKTPPATEAAPAQPAADAAPKLTPEQKDSLREKQVQLQSNILQQYQMRDQYNATQAKLEEQSKQIAQALEGLVATYQKNVDATKWVLDRSTLAFVPAPAPPVKK